MANTTVSSPAPATQDRPWVAGVALILLGVLLFAAQFVEQNDWVILGGLAAVFFALYGWTRKAGWIIPAMILGGLAIGLGFEDYGYDANGGIIVLGLAAGFIGIYLFNVVARVPAHWWPLVPGSILAVVGGSLALGGTQAAEVVGRFWPLALILLGVIVLFGGRQQLIGGPKT